MEWWEGFTGWLITAVLVGIAAIGQVLDWGRRIFHRTQARPFLSHLGQHTFRDGEVAEVIEFTNYGDHTATDFGVGAVGGELGHPSTPDGSPSATLPPSSTVRYFVITDAPEEAWVLVRWTHRHVRRKTRVRVTWFPVLGQNSPLQDEWQRQQRTRPRWWKPWAFFTRSGPRHVGPGGVLTARPRAGDQQQQDEALGALPTSPNDLDAPDA